MKQTFLVIIIFCICSCHHSVERNSVDATDTLNKPIVDDFLIAKNTGFYPIHFDSTNYTIIKFSKNTNYLFKDAEPTSLSDVEVKQIETLLNRSITDYNNDLKNKNFIINPREHKAQFIPVINSDNEKEVWVNCFCYNPSEHLQGELSKFKTNWREDIVVFSDGGTCFFNLKINLKKNKYYNLIVNGVA